MMQFKLGKKERLTSNKEIEALFDANQKLSAFPIIVYYQRMNGAHHKVAFTASKKVFKKAVNRNRIKRKMREYYRLNKHLTKNVVPNLNIIFIYIGKKEEDEALIKEKIIYCLNQLNSKNK